MTLPYESYEINNFRRFNPFKLYLSTRNTHRPPKDKTHLVILQVPDDANMIIHNEYLSHTQFLKDLLKVSSYEDNFVVREHPKYKGKYERDLYDMIGNEERLFFDFNESLKSSFNETNSVIVMNSMVGVEAFASGKTVYSYARSYYENFTYKSKNNNSPNFQSQFSNDEYQKVEYFLFNLIFNFLHQGHFRDEDLSFTDQIAEKII